MRNVRALNLANEVITVADSSLLEPGALQPWSLLIWFKCNSSVPTTVLVSKKDSYGYSLAISAGDKLVGAVTDVNEDSGSITGGTSILPNVWYLGVLTSDAGGNLNLFLNGVSDAIEVASGADGGLADAVDMLITDSAFSGQLGEVQVLVGHELSAGEALGLYNRGISKGLKPTYGAGDVRLWLRWKNRVLKDNSGYDNQLSGATVTSIDRVRIQGYR